MNDFRIEHDVFTREVKQTQIAKIQQLMPKNSELYQQLKVVADKKQNGPRGFTYPCLVGIVSGFSEAYAQYNRKGLLVKELILMKETLNV